MMTSSVLKNAWLALSLPKGEAAIAGARLLEQVITKPGVLQHQHQTGGQQPRNGE